jgi:ParB-like chromosome segregation protein Spo0J
MSTTERIGDYLVHPAAQLFPLLDEASEDFAKLKNSIADHGQQVPIVVRDGVLLDGRNRLRACLALGILANVEEYSGTLLPSELVGDLNLNRRHDLSPEERARIWAELELMTQAERQAAAQKAAGEKYGRGRPKKVTTESREAISEPKSRERHARETVGRVAKAAGVSYPAARKALKEAKERAGTAAKKATAPTAPKPKRRMAEQGALLIAGGSVQRTHTLLLEFAARTTPVSRADIARRLGAKSPRDERRQVEAFLDCASHVPWAAIDKVDGGFRLTVNAPLKQLCDQQTPLTEVNGWTPQDIVSFLRSLRRAITEKRAANKCERTRRQWNPDAVLKLELLKLVEFIELELDKITSPKLPPVERQAEQRLNQPSAGDADPTKGDSYVN